MKRWLLFCLTLLLLGCQPVSGTPDAQESVSEGDIQRLSPAYTPTPEPTPLPTLAPTPDVPGGDPSSALLPDFAEEAAAGESTRYFLDMELTPGGEGMNLRGVARVRYTNTSSEAIHTLAFLLLPNLNQTAPVMTAGPAMVDGSLFPVVMAEDGTSFTVELEHALSSGAMLDVSIPFSMSAALGDGVFYMDAPYPLIPRFEDGWQTTLSPYARMMASAPVAQVEMVIRAPADLDVVLSGSVVEESREDDEQVIHAVSGPVRIVALAVGEFSEVTRSAGDVLLRAWMLPGHEEEADAILRAAETMVSLLGEAWTPYPYAELDLVDVPGGGATAAGIAPLETVGTNTVLDEALLAVVTQWTAGMLGSDVVEEAWVSESLTYFARSLYDESRFGIGAGTGYLTNLRAELRSDGNPALPLGQRALTFETSAAYTLAMGYKGALFLETLRWEMGRTAFDAFLETLFQDTRFGFVREDDLELYAADACSCDLDAVFHLWVHNGGELPTP